MAFWTTEKLLDELRNNKLIPGYLPARVKVGAYELGLGSEYFVTADAAGHRQHTKQSLLAGQQLVIPQGQFALLITEEFLNVPHNVIGFISIKARVKFRGLVNVSGFHVDPGFTGRLKFSVYNAGPQPVILGRGLPAFLIWFADLDRTTGFPYAGEHQGQDSISPEDVAMITGEVASPAELKREMAELRAFATREVNEAKNAVASIKSTLERRVKLWIAPTISAIVGGLIVLLFQFVLQKNESKERETEKTSTNHKAPQTPASTLQQRANENTPK